MTPFLKLVADDLYQKLGGDFQNTTIIFPNKRATLFFNQYLWENANGNTMWAPEYTSISELFASLSDYTIADPIYLIVRLFEVYAKKIQPTKSLDQLYSLMEMMLSDFQDIDNNLVEPSQLFLNIADLKEMTDFSFLEPEQREAIEQFFGKFLDIHHSDTPLKAQFKTLWNCLTDIYEQYKQTLLHPLDGEPMIYEGMLKRLVVNALNSKNEEERKRIDARLRSHTYVMVGFNILNKTELELFRYIKQHRDAKFYWDYDETYTKQASTSKLLSKYEAGQFILENIAKLGDEFKGKDLFNNMKHSKKIMFVQSPTDNAQTRYIHQWMRTHIKQDEPLQESAIILCNENLLQPVLHSIPYKSLSSDDESIALNITMGYPITNTPAYSLVQALLELQLHGRTHFGAWRYKYVSAVLKHPFIHKVVGKDCSNKLADLSKRNVVFPESSEFADNDILQKLFSPVSGSKLTAYLSDVISLVGHSYQDAFSSKDFTLQIYKESIFVAYTTINRIHTLQEETLSLNVSDETLSRLIMQSLKQSTIPFHGEPAVGLQVMGLLETRNLDFRNVIMLSVNEGQIPKSDKRASLIPYTLRAAYGMTTIEKEVSLYAYYYYRLLQRAESITLLYNSNTEGGKKGEMSRFMLQTLAEKNELFSENQTIEQRAFTSPNDTPPIKQHQVLKDEAVMERLHNRFNAEHSFSPTALNTYMKCPLKFYFTYVAGLRPEKEVSEDVDNPMFGTLFHYAIQKLYEPYIGKPLSSTKLQAMAEDTALITQMLNNAFAVELFKKPKEDEQKNTINYGINVDHKLALNGSQLIIRHVIKDFIVNQIQADMKMAEQLESEGGYLQIISQEKEYTTVYPSASIHIGGKIDRLDLLHSPQGDKIRIVDYKTSYNQQSANTVADLFNLEKCTKNYHIMQTLLYAYVLSSEYYTHTPVCPALMYCAKSNSNNYSGIIKLENPNSLTSSGNPKKEAITDFKVQYGEEFNALLTDKIKEIFTPYQANTHSENINEGIFTQCQDEQNCKYCDFLSFCLRKPKSTY